MAKFREEISQPVPREPFFRLSCAGRFPVDWISVVVVCGGLHAGGSMS